MNNKPYIEEKSGVYRFTEPVDAALIITLAQQLIAERYKRGTVLSSPDDTKRFVNLMLSTYEQEVFYCIFLDNRHRIISSEPMFFGTIDGANVHPREVVKKALFHNAAAIICAHNHPSGIAEPSRADQVITKQLKDALALVSVRVLDHMIVGADEIVSLAERGLM